MDHWTTILYWIGINIALGVFGPFLIGIAAVWFLHPVPKITVRQFYEKGELGLVSLVTGLSVVFDVNKSHCSSLLKNETALTLFLGCAVAAWIWAVPLVFNLAGVKGVNWKKVWSSSWRVALMVFSIGLVAEILLELAQ